MGGHNVKAWEKCKLVCHLGVQLGGRFGLRVSQRATSPAKGTSADSAALRVTCASHPGCRARIDWCCLVGGLGHRGLLHLEHYLEGSRTRTVRVDQG
jgi:hypothetical protein